MVDGEPGGTLSRPQRRRDDAKCGGLGQGIEELESAEDGLRFHVEAWNRLPRLAETGRFLREGGESQGSGQLSPGEALAFRIETKFGDEGAVGDKNERFLHPIVGGEKHGKSEVAAVEGGAFNCLERGPPRELDQRLMAEGVHRLAASRVLNNEGIPGAQVDQGWSGRKRKNGGKKEAEENSHEDLVSDGVVAFPRGRRKINMVTKPLQRMSEPVHFPNHPGSRRICTELWERSLGFHEA